jgi:replication factor C small subunit
MKIESNLWVERWRPKTVGDMVLPQNYKDEIEMFVGKGDIPNMLLSGPAGGGKTTLARIICSPQGVLNTPKSNLLEANGSSREARSINFVQEVIEPFLKVPPAGDDRYKIVFIDEIDNLTLDSFKSLRGVIEKYQTRYGRFIGTCNYLSKVPDPVQSRFTPFVFKQIPMDYVEAYASKILKEENIEYTDEDIRFVVENLYPDVRKIVNTLQRNTNTGKLLINKDIALTTEKALIGSIVEIMNYIKAGTPAKINKEMGNVITLLDKPDLEYGNIYEALFKHKSIPVPAKIIINKASRDHLTCLVPSMHVSSMIFEMIQSATQYFANLKR